MHNLIIENRDGCDMRCYDGESENALNGISEKSQVKFTVLAKSGD
ncbi:hypothetical protein [Pseudoalteromonas rubra]|nr:hypothetical protein [Pseudoalteromonas rubra]